MKEKAINRKDISFDNRADQYDKGYEGKASRRFYNNLVEAYDLPMRAKVLDVGCGTGEVLYRMNQKNSIDGYGIDVSSEMLRNAKRKNPDMNFKIGDCGKLPFTNESMDGIITCMAYHHFPDQESFRKEAYRVLRRGGKLYICDPNWPHVLRKLLNLIFRISNQQARFYKMEELIKQFEMEGFTALKWKKDAYVQVLVLSRG